MSFLLSFTFVTYIPNPKEEIISTLSNLRLGFRTHPPTMEDGFEFDWDIRNFKNLGSNLVLIILLTKRDESFGCFINQKIGFDFGWVISILVGFIRFWLGYFDFGWVFLF
jgi:hypothetical protein